MELVGREYFGIMAMIAMIGGAAIAFWLVVALYAMRTRKQEEQSRLIDMPEGLQEAEVGIPPALLLFYVMNILVMVAYVLYNAAAGVSY